jgi:hypothetical protein
MKQFVTWLPVDVAAVAMLDLLKSSPKVSSPCTYVNLVHPHPVEWNKLFEVASNHLQVELVPYKDWLERLRSFKDRGTAESSDHLLEFFLQSRGLGDGIFTRDRTLELCPSLRGTKPLDGQDMLKYLVFWGL